MWKEKYQALETQFTEFRNAVARDAAAALRPSASNGDDDPGILKLNVETTTLRTSIEKPEVQVRVKRRIIEMNDSTLDGKIARLISEDFFKSPKQTADVFRELVRIGAIPKNASKTGATVAREVIKLAGMGFLVLEDKGYQAVPGMKVNIVESNA